MERIVVLSIAVLGACAPAHAPTVTIPRAPRAESPWAESAAAGVRNAALSELLFQHWEWQMREFPEWATELGDHRFDDRLADKSKAARERRHREGEAFLAEAEIIRVNAERSSEARTTLGTEGRWFLNSEDRTTLAIFTERLAASLETDICRSAEWSISARDNPVAQWNYLPVEHQVATEVDARNLVSRYRGIAAAIDVDIANLRLGAADGLFPNAESTRRALTMVREQLAEPDDEWTLLEPVTKEHPTFAPDFLASYRADLTEIVRVQIRPALVRYAEFLEMEIAPHARPETATGLDALALGAACYQAQIRNHAGVAQSAAEIHEIGLREIRRINDEMRALGQILFGADDLTTILGRLRGDPELYFQTAEEVEGKARHALDAAAARIPEWFGVLPAATCEVVRVPDYEAPFTTVAYYREPNPDGSKPGEYFINVYEPTTRPRFEAEVLAYHESIPGHHLQIAIAQELSLPAFRRFTGINAYLEGWALYTERLANEMGLYTSDLDRMGMLSFDAWRASRLVVDTGLHTQGWSREQAVEFMLEHTALTENNIRNEVDRYIVWPGQALSYKLGQLEFLRLRALAERELGDRFDIRGFHDAVLTGGAVTMPVLEERVRVWIELAR